MVAAAAAALRLVVDPPTTRRDTAFPLQVRPATQIPPDRGANPPGLSRHIGTTRVAVTAAWTSSVRGRRSGA